MSTAPRIDAHTHFFSRVFFETLAGLSPLPGTVDERLAAVAAETELALPSRDPQEHLRCWLTAFDDHGVDHAVTFASVPAEAPVVRDAVRATKGRLTGYVLINPLADADGSKTRAHFEEDGFRGVLLFPAQHHYRMSDKAIRPVLDVVAERGGVVVVHCGLLKVKLRDLLSLPNTVDLRFANPLDIVPAANACPGAHFVIPHFGAGFLRECLMAGDMARNIYVDTSSSNAWMRTQATPMTLRDVLARALDVYGAERVLFGTDSSTFPRGWRKDLYDAQLEAVTGLGVPASEQAKIFGGNMTRILNLG